MLVKTFEIRRRYLHGFDNPQTVVIEVVDVDRKLTVLIGNEISERIMTQFKGMTIGLEMAGYIVDVERTIEIDETNGNTRISVLNK